MAGRRLTAILAADIAGYSALMSANEIETVSSLKGHQSVVLPMIAGFEGRIIDTAGDGVLAEFPSVLNAAKCAASIQEVMKERNASVPPDRRMQFRIGINQGDVLFDEHRIFGDGINIAARLEGLCDPGDICISGKVFDEIRERFEVHYEDIGPQKLKNISVPVRAYKIRVGGAAARSAPGKLASSASDASSLRSSYPPSGQRKVWMVAAVVSILMIGSGAAWWSLPLGQSSEQADKPVKASAPAMSVVEQTLRPAGARAESNSGRENIQIAAAAPEPEPSLPLSATKSLASSVVAPADANHADAVATEKKFMTAAAPPARPVSQPPAAIIPPQPQSNIGLPENKPSDSSWDVAALARQGQLSAKNNDYSRAKLYFDEILRIQPGNAEALNNRCWVSAILGELTAALKDCDAALRLRPNYIDAFDSRGFVKLKIGAPRDAIDDYDAALKIQSQKASSLYGRGIAKQRAGNASGGNADIARAKAIDPRVADEFASYGIR